MPQTSQAVQDIIDKWFPKEITVKANQYEATVGQDWQACNVLLSKGWTEKNGMFSPPTPSHYGPREEYVLLRYLVEEWDYAYETAPIIEVK